MATKHEYRVGKDILVISTTGAMTPVGSTNSGIDVNTATETIAAGGTTTALALTVNHHDIDADAGGDIFTLADGTEGQVTTCVLKSATGIATITPATFLGGTSVTLAAAGASVTFRFQGTLGWSIIGQNAATVI